MPLINVRVTPEDARRAAALRESGVPISRLVREAIRAEYERRRPGQRRGRRASRVMAEIYAALPDPPDLPPRRYDAADRVAVRNAISGRLRRKPR